MLSQFALPSMIARRRSIMTAEVSVHLPLPLCSRKTLSSFIVTASALTAIAGSMVSTSVNTSIMLSIRFFISSLFVPPVWIELCRAGKNAHSNVIIDQNTAAIKEFKRIFTFSEAH